MSAAFRKRLFSALQSLHSPRSEPRTARAGLFTMTHISVVPLSPPEITACSKRLAVFVALLGGGVLMLFVAVSLHLPLVWDVVRTASHLDSATNPGVCDEPCSLVLVESIPEGLIFPDGSPVHPSIFQRWSDLLHTSSQTVQVASFYWTLRDSDLHINESSAAQGKAVMDAFLALPARGVSLQLATDGSSNARKQSQPDLADLTSKGANLSYVDFSTLTGGVLHTKLWVVDDTHTYVGSANMDWRSLTQVKELGAVVYNCSCLARDVQKIFLQYRALAGQKTIPSVWPSQFSTSFNRHTPLHVRLNGTPAEVYVSSSPMSLCATGRTDDLVAIVNQINHASKFVYVAVMDYFPTSRYEKHRRFWPKIDDALRKAAFEHSVQVRVMASCWNHSDLAMFSFLQSLSAFSGALKHGKIETKFFVVPSTEAQKKIPYARVNHNKYMVTDKIAYIGTSNWSEDYFSNTAGVGLLVNQTASVGRGVTVQEQLRDVFLRDWNSPYAISPTSLADLQAKC